MTGKRVLSIGQCQADHSRISRLLHTQFSADVVAADTAEQALKHLQRERFALVLVNRVFDADSHSGLDFIRALRQRADIPEMPVMLVSNFPEAQEEAAAAGAVPGFGKDHLHELETIEKLRRYLGD
jgi:CheY-like chemotaxis protein